MRYKMKSQDKSIETLKLKGTLELLIEKYGYERVQEVFIDCKVPKKCCCCGELKAICKDEGITYINFPN